MDLSERQTAAVGTNMLIQYVMIYALDPTVEFPHISKNNTFYFLFISFLFLKFFFSPLPFISPLSQL